MFTQSTDFAKILLEILSLKYAQKLSLICKSWAAIIRQMLYKIVRSKVISEEFMPKKIAFSSKFMEDKKGLIHKLWLPIFDHYVFIRYLPKSHKEQRWLCFKFQDPVMDIMVKENKYYLYYDECFNFTTQKQTKLNQMPIDFLMPFLINKDSCFHIIVYHSDRVISTRVNMRSSENNDNIEVSLTEFKIWVQTLEDSSKNKLNAILKVVKI